MFRSSRIVLLGFLGRAGRQLAFLGLLNCFGTYEFKGDMSEISPRMFWFFRVRFFGFGMFFLFWEAGFGSSVSLVWMRCSVFLSDEITLVF